MHQTFDTKEKRIMLSVFIFSMVDLTITGVTYTSNITQC